MAKHQNIILHTPISYSWLQVPYQSKINPIPSMLTSKTKVTFDLHSVIIFLEISWDHRKHHILYLCILLPKLSTFMWLSISNVDH
jgi:hypothetical protein